MPKYLPFKHYSGGRSRTPSRRWTSGRPRMQRRTWPSCGRSKHYCRRTGEYVDGQALTPRRPGKGTACGAAEQLGYPSSITPKMSRRIPVTMAETSSEPPQPSLLEKKMNMTYRMEWVRPVAKYPLVRPCNRSSAGSR